MLTPTLKHRGFFSPWRVGAMLVLLVASTPACALHLGESDRLYLLLGLPAWLVFERYSRRQRRRCLHRLIAPNLLPAHLQGFPGSITLWKALLRSIAIVGMVLALARPQLGFVWQEVEDHGIDIVVAMDLSDSMLVHDADSQNQLPRLKRAKREVIDLLRVLQGDRIALVGFAGEAFLACPLTSDYGAVDRFSCNVSRKFLAAKSRKNPQKKNSDYKVLILFYSLPFASFALFCGHSIFKLSENIFNRG